MPRKEHHVVYNSTLHKWDVKRPNSKRVSARADTKEKAIKIGREMSIRGKTELVIHNIGGKISNSDSHGNDPCPPRDKR